MKYGLLIVIVFLVKNYICNPYSVLGVAPYYSMKDIKEKYLELMAQNHPEKITLNTDDMKTNYEKIQKAYEEIRHSRKDEDDDDDSSAAGYLFAMKKCFWSIFFGVVIVLILYLVVSLAYEILNFTYRFIVILIFIFFPTEYFLAHKFENEETQYLFSILMSLSIVSGLYLRNKFFAKIEKETESKENSPLLKNN